MEEGVNLGVVILGCAYARLGAYQAGQISNRAYTYFVITLHFVG